MTTALDTIAALTGALQAVTELTKAAQALGREPTEEELDEAVVQSFAKSARARQMVAIAAAREQPQNG